MYYTLSIVSSDDAMGTACAGGGATVIRVREGEKVLLTATARDDYVFTGWTIDDNVVSSQNPFEYTMPPQDVTIAANFAEWNEDEVFELTVEANDGGGRAYVVYPNVDNNAFPAWKESPWKPSHIRKFEFECWSSDGESVEPTA